MGRLELLDQSKFTRLPIFGTPAAKGQLLAEANLLRPTNFTRRHFVPEETLDPYHRVELDGEVGIPLRLTTNSLRKLGKETITAVKECAGNYRGFILEKEKIAPGEVMWGSGGAVRVKATGVLLSTILNIAKPFNSIKEIVFRASDSGKTAQSENTTFERSLPMEVVRHRSESILIAYEMNGHEINPRLVVPGWYSMSWVGDLEQITASSEEFGGFFQKDRYVIPTDEGQSIPVREIVPRSRIKSVQLVVRNGDGLFAGTVIVWGDAWSADSRKISQVELSFDDGKNWTPTNFRFKLKSPFDAWEWVAYIEKFPKGEIELLTRTVDRKGESLQPEYAAINKHGYAYNGWRPGIQIKTS